MRSIVFLLLFAACVIVFSSCEEDVTADNCQGASELCTEEFITISLEITTPDGKPVILDNFYTFFDARKRIHFNETQKSEGIYPVISDEYLSEIDREGSVLVFVGRKDDRNIVEYQVFVGRNCCHVFLIEGENEIVIESL